MNRNYILRKIGAPLPKSQLVVDDQDAGDIMKRMMLKHKKCAAEYDRIAADFAGRDIYETAENLWNFCKKNIEYREESLDSQNVSSPQTILSRGHCDCKGYALFIGGVLDALNRQGWNIKWKYRFASDDLFSSIPGHVFVVINDGGYEIWVDPVLSQFNQDHWFPYSQDRKVTASQKVAGCGCGGHAMGSTTAQEGNTIMAIAPALAAVPVVGWIGGAAAEVIGGIVSIVGSKWNQSPDVRWLIQLYQYYALGQSNVTSDNKVNESYTQQAQAWFSVVLGVPIGGRSDFNILQTGNSNSNTPTGVAAATRANDYLVWKGLSTQISNDQALSAANIAATMNPIGAQAGAWAGLTPAPSTIQPAAETSPSLVVDQNGNLTTASGAPVTATSNNEILLLAAAAVALFLIIK
jgi:hypothetical protein